MFKNLDSRSFAFANKRILPGKETARTRDRQPAPCRYRFCRLYDVFADIWIREAQFEAAGRVD